MKQKQHLNVLLLLVHFQIPEMHPQYYSVHVGDYKND